MASPNIGTQAKEELKSELDTLKSDLGKLRADLRNLAEALLEQGRSSASAARHQVQEQVETGLERVQEYIEERPITAMAVMFGLGLVLGKLMGHSK